MPEQSRESGQGNRDLLHLCAGFAGKDQDAVIRGHHRIPIGALCKRLSAGAVGQGDLIRQRQRGRFPVQTGDKQANHDYNAANHHGRQHGYENSQKLKIGRQFRLRSFVHDIQVRYISDRGKPACAP